MNRHTDRSLAALYHEAARCWVEGHQACAWCREPHCVFRTQRGSRLEYSCNHCDFYVSRDVQTGQYHSVPGLARPARAAV